MGDTRCVVFPHWYNVRSPQHTISDYNKFNAIPTLSYILYIYST